MQRRNANVLDRIIRDLTDEIIVDIGALYKASEAVALLDLLWSFAHASICRFSSISSVYMHRLMQI